MNSNQIAIIKRTLTDIKLFEIRKLEGLPDIKAEFSDEYKKNINKLIQGQKYKHTSAKSKIIAAIIAATLIVAFAVTAVAYGNQIREFFIDIGKGFTRLFSEDEESATVENIYYAAWVPDGYEQIEQSNYETAVHTTWFDGENEIQLEQLALGSTSIRLDTEDTSYQMVQIGNKTVHYTLKYGTYSMAWIESDYTFTLNCQDSIPWEDIQKIILNLYSTEQ